MDAHVPDAPSSIPRRRCAPERGSRYDISRAHGPFASHPRRLAASPPAQPDDDIGLRSELANAEMEIDELNAYIAQLQAQRPHAKEQAPVDPSLTSRATDARRRLWSGLSDGVTTTFSPPSFRPLSPSADDGVAAASPSEERHQLAVPPPLPPDPTQPTTDVLTSPSTPCAASPTSDASRALAGSAPSPPRLKGDERAAQGRLAAMAPPLAVVALSLLLVIVALDPNLLDDINYLTNGLGDSLTKYWAAPDEPTCAPAFDDRGCFGVPTPWSTLYLCMR